MGASVSGGRSGGKRRMNADINVVPFIDVMLVLLIIFPDIALWLPRVLLN